ncbi:MAG: flagellar basal body rod protein FlgC [Oscillospiraceae bacterium]|jgi:flagellar basal-body rod protein FlgC|nr:flagellar basal body rod protein FlgC [Oscillospiraceae bacterium]
MAFLSYLDISVSAMAAQRLRTEVIQHNVANAHSTRTESGGPYRRQVVVFGEHRPFKNMQTGKNYVTNRNFGSILEMTMAERRQRRLAGVRVLQIVEDPTPLTPIFDPTHPDANEEGYYYLPNVDIAEEQMDMLAATRSYEANLTIFDELKNMATKALTIGR